MITLTHGMTPELKSAIASVYDAFADAAKPVSVEGCPCCIDEKNVNILLSKPLRELLPAELSSYASSVFLTVGAVPDYLYFLPRILEILVSERYWWPNPEVFAQSLHTAGFHTWPDSRRGAVSRYFDAVLDELLDTDNSGHDLDSWICALGRLHVDLIPFLERIRCRPPRLAEYYENNSQELMDGSLSNSFWDEAPDEQKQVVEWFKSTKISQVIMSHYGLG